MQNDFRVLARKYRPAVLKDVIGQEELVTALAASIENDRLPHAFIFHGTRGVGKTTTARVLARALNCMVSVKPTLNPCGTCESCQAIIEDRFLDVIEMDAASRTGIDDIREIIDSLKYKAVMGRFKVYIIDEVHMLSKSAFNALLKTLEEPPAHVKFIFATTEIHKVPDTILSRCMRFDLKRVGPQTLKNHLTRIADKEKISIEPDALALLTRAAEGSVRDGLSLLDQAIALSNKNQQVKAETVRSMLGLVEKGQLYDILDHLFSGQLEPALLKFRKIYECGGDPATILQELLDILYWIICLKATPHLSQDESWSEQDRQDGLKIANGVKLPALMRAWQVIMQGLQDVNRAPSPVQATEMLFVRLVYMADLPSTEDLIKSFTGKDFKNEINSTVLESQVDETHAPIKQNSEESELHSVAGIVPETFEKLVEFVGNCREPMLYTHLLQDVHLVDYKVGSIQLKLLENAPQNLLRNLKAFLEKETNLKWVVDSVDREEDSPPRQSLFDYQQDQKLALKTKSNDHPLINQFAESFPGARIKVNDPEE